MIRNSESIVHFRLAVNTVHANASHFQVYNWQKNQDAEVG